MICTCSIQNDAVARHEAKCALCGSPHFHPRMETIYGKSSIKSAIEKGADTRLQTLEREFWERCILATVGSVNYYCARCISDADFLLDEWRKRFAKEEEPATIPWKKRIANEP